MSKDLVRHLAACLRELRETAPEKSFVMQGMGFMYDLVNNYVEKRRVFTDYPFVELGDKPGVKAPIRECELIAYDGNKYCLVKVNDTILEVKYGYLYKRPGRCGEVECLDFKLLEEKKANF